MFSGIISWLEPVKQIKKAKNNLIVTISKPKKLKLKIGDSISVDGVCSTVIKQTSTSFVVEYMPETIKLTKPLVVKDKVNLETSLKFNDILSGHLVSGHIDCVGQVINFKNNVLKIKYPKKFKKYIIRKGSVSINGISLTVSKLTANYLEVSLISHTVKNTNLQYLKINDKVNLEFDLIGKYVEQISHV